MRRAYRAYAVSELRVEPDGPCVRADWTFAPLRHSRRELTVSTDDVTSLSSSLSSSLRNDSVDNLLLAGRESTGSDCSDEHERERSLRSARMLCCATLAEAMAKFDMFLEDWSPPRTKYGDEYLNVLNIVVLSVTTPASTLSPTAARSASASEHPANTFSVSCCLRFRRTFLSDTFRTRY